MSDTVTEGIRVRGGVVMRDVARSASWCRPFAKHASARRASRRTICGFTTHPISAHPAVRSFYQPSASMPQRGHFIYGYHVTITNESERVVMLRNR